MRLWWWQLNLCCWTSSLYEEAAWALIFLLKLFSLHIVFCSKRSICDIEFIKHFKKTCEAFTGRGPHSTKKTQFFAGRTISGRGQHLARGPQFAHPCPIQVEQPRGGKQAISNVFDRSLFFSIKDSVICVVVEKSTSFFNLSKDIILRSCSHVQSVSTGMPQR